jgi:phospholipase/carboxylesterase
MLARVDLVTASMTQTGSRPQKPKLTRNQLDGGPMSQDLIEVETGPNPVATIIWMHGLGADGHDFEPIVPELGRRGEPSLWFVFPHAPVRPVTLNNGYRMRAWYDIISIQRGAAQDEVGIRASHAIVEALIRRENERGIPSNKIVLAGFSQGGAMALYSGTRYPEKLAGIMGLSCYMLLESRFAAERSAPNHTTSIFLGHGTQDPVVSLALGEATRRMLETQGHPVEWHAYPMAHSVCPQEVADIADWLRRVV